MKHSQEQSLLNVEAYKIRKRIKCELYYSLNGCTYEKTKAESKHICYSETDVSPDTEQTRDVIF